MENGQQPSNLQMSYEQFQDQIRQNQERDQMLAKQALQQAGADSRSDKIRTLMAQLQGIQSELQLADNQIQMQMDAQRRQLGQVMERINQMERQLNVVMNLPQSPLQ
jgi:predicted metal-dependent HD superfamily phosphohydrolase